MDVFLQNLRETAARRGKPDVKLAAELTGESRSLIYRIRRTERGKKLKEGWRSDRPKIAAPAASPLLRSRTSRGIDLRPLL